MIDQFRKSLRGSCAYLLVSKMSPTLNFPTVNTSRSDVCAAGELVDACIHLLRFAAKVDGLPDEGAMQARIGIVRALLVGLAAGEAGNAKRSAQAESPDRFPD